MPESIKRLFEGNQAFVDQMNAEHPDLFESLGKGQSPEYLWIGCADSRVPATQLTNTPPGSIFVHRNIANVVVHSDVNLMSVAFYAVTVLKVKHIVVCGHYGCGGVAAAISKNSYGYIDGWVNHIKDVYRLHRSELDGTDETTKFNKMVEFNVQEQVSNMARISFVQDMWKQGEYPYIHGVVYDVADGKLKDLNCTVNSPDGVDDIFVFNP
ncbi:MAG: carbonic anhydrase [Flavobacteriia bacterium]|nr:carbonic anhydrase [Flavobacteriia bacterium]